MDVFSLISMFGGLALFLYGMSILGSGLERISGGRLESTLEKLTSNIFKAALLGALVTAAIQSSSATTVIVVGLVNARVLKLRNAIGVIMGANIGTTITAHIIRLTDLASLIGILLFMGSKRARRRDIGQILLGFGILFTGMFSMEAAVKPLADLPAFSQMFAAFGSIPLLGVIVGAVVTAVIQSSSASVGILQALSSTGQITYAMAFPIIMGQNIGTTITPILASIGASKNAKRAACVHITFNILGTVIFLIGCYAIQYTIGFPFWDLSIDKGGIATFLFIPFAGILEKIACTVVKDDPQSNEIDITTVTLDDRLMVSPGLALEHAREAVVQMAVVARHNFINAVSLLDAFDPKTVDRINENEDVVDKLENRVETYLLTLSEKELSESESREISELLHTCGEFERVADHAQNIAECAEKLFQSKSNLSKRASEEMHVISEAVKEILDLAIEAFKKANVQVAQNVEPLEEVVDEMEQILRDKHFERLRKGKCTLDSAFPFVEALSNIERIADLCSNVAESVGTYDGDRKSIDRHLYKKAQVQSESYQDKYIVYTTKYLNRIKK